jgi:anti-sigma factor RsiW
MECTRTEDLLSAYLDGDLPEREREGFSEHLRQCPRCAGEEKALKETLSLLRNLPTEKAPPGLLEGVRRRIGQEKETVPLWKKLFLPAHIKIPLEAAAVALIFLLAYGIQKEMPATKPPTSPPAKEMAATNAPPSPSAADESGKPSPGADIQAGRQKADASSRLPADVADRKVEAKKASVEPGEEAPFETEQASTPAPSPVKPPLLSKSEIPAGLASRVSTKGEAIEPATPRESPAKEAPGPRAFGEQLSRLKRPSPYGKEVTIEVARDDRIGMEDRITELALRLGGGVRRGGTFTAGSGPGETTLLSEILQVSIPADSEDDFLEGLGRMGTIPPEGKPGKTDISAGSSSATIVYTVRIRVR